MLNVTREWMWNFELIALSPIFLEHWETKHKWSGVPTSLKSVRHWSVPTRLKLLYRTLCAE